MACIFLFLWHLNLCSLLRNGVLLLFCAINQLMPDRWKYKQNKNFSLDIEESAMNLFFRENIHYKSFNCLKSDKKLYNMDFGWLAHQCWGIWWIWHACPPKAKPFESTPASQQSRFKCVWKQSWLLCKYTKPSAAIHWLWNETNDETNIQRQMCLPLKLIMYTTKACWGHLFYSSQMFSWNNSHSHRHFTLDIVLHAFSSHYIVIVMCLYGNGKHEMSNSEQILLWTKHMPKSSALSLMEIYILQLSLITDVQMYFSSSL